MALGHPDDLFSQSMIHGSTVCFVVRPLMPTIARRDKKPFQFKLSHTRGSRPLFCESVMNEMTIGPKQCPTGFDEHVGKTSLHGTLSTIMLAALASEHTGTFQPDLRPLRKQSLPRPLRILNKPGTTLSSKCTNIWKKTMMDKPHCLI